MANKLKWLDIEAGGANVSVQPVLVGEDLFYVLFDATGMNYVFYSIYALHLHWSGVENCYCFSCGSEDELVEYLKNWNNG